MRSQETQMVLHLHMHFANLLKSHMAPNWLRPPPLSMSLLPSHNPFPFIAYHDVKDMSSDGAGSVLGFNYLP